VYIGVLCDNCDYKLKVRYVREELLKDGENRLLHLKAGDEVVFKLDQVLEKQKEILISSYNLKTSKYRMNVDIVSKDASTQIIKVPVQDNWFGGQVARLVNNADKQYEYKVTLFAVKDSVLSIEARSIGSIIPINDKSIRFDFVKPNEGICYNYNIDEKQKDMTLVVQAKSIKGDLDISLSPEALKSNTADLIHVNVISEKDIRYTLTPDLRKSQHSGNWLICVNSKDNAYFQMNVYRSDNTEAVNEYKHLLFSKFILTTRSY
jgi:hypothetical protein